MGLLKSFMVLARSLRCALRMVGFHQPERAFEPSRVHPPHPVAGVVFGTLIETGSGLIHGMNERIAHAFQERGREMQRMARPVLALPLLLAGAVLSGVGPVDLIARGYGSLTWVFLVVYVLPVLTLGLWRITRTGVKPLQQP